MSKRNNEAPDRIWLQLHGDAEPPFDDRDHPPWADVSWCSEPVFAHDVEYVRADLAADLVDALKTIASCKGFDLIEDKAAAMRVCAFNALAAYKSQRGSEDE